MPRAALPGIDELRALSMWSSLDRQLADMALRVSEQASALLWISVALVSAATRQGDVCIELDRMAGRHLASVLADLGRETDVADLGQWILPELASWREALGASDLLGSGANAAPLRLKGNRLYLAVHYRHEATLARRVAERLVEVTLPLAAETARALLQRWMGGASVRSIQAAALALARRLCIITGGPGSGKTSTVVRLLGMLAEVSQSRGDTLRAVLVAPTGKAAARLSEAIVQAKQRLTDLPSIEIPTTTSTVHRALGACRLLPDGSRVPMFADVVVLDEASMVDLDLMSQLMDVAAGVERFIVLGDAQQLASVQAGAVLGELCALRRVAYSRCVTELLEQWTGVGSALPLSSERSADSDRILRPETSASCSVSDHIVELTESHRFRSDGGIGLLAHHINQGDVAGTLRVLESGDSEIRLVEQSAYAIEAVTNQISQSCGELWQAGSATLALDLMDRCRVLCAHRRGEFGVEIWNERLGWRARALQGHRMSKGRVEPILLTQNSADSSLRNGDLGIVWRTTEGARAWFALPNGERRPFGLSTLQAYEPAYAISIHKSQGSEADEVFVILPDANSPLLTRELLYTAVTRARRRCVVLATREAIRVAVSRRVERKSGLADAIIEATAKTGASSRPPE